MTDRDFPLALPFDAESFVRSARDTDGRLEIVLAVPFGGETCELVVRLSTSAETSLTDALVNGPGGRDVVRIDALAGE